MAAGLPLEELSKASAKLKETSFLVLRLRIEPMHAHDVSCNAML